MTKINLIIEIDENGDAKCREEISGTELWKCDFEAKIINAYAGALGVRCAQDFKREKDALELLDKAYDLSETVLKKCVQQNNKQGGKENQQWQK